MLRARPRTVGGPFTFPLCRGGALCGGAEASAVETSGGGHGLVPGW